MDQKEDKKRDDEGLDRLTDHNDGRRVEKPAIDFVERGFDHENAEQLFDAVIGIKNSKFSSHGRVILVRAGGYHERGALTGGLAQFDIADIG